MLAQFSVPMEFPQINGKGKVLNNLTLTSQQRLPKLGGPQCLVASWAPVPGFLLFHHKFCENKVFWCNFPNIFYNNDGKS